MPLDKACLLACGVVTGVGATMNTTPVWAGSRVAVIGCGGVGLSVIQGAKIAHARQIIAVDVNPTKLEWAKNFGATHTVNPRDGDPVAAVRALTEDGWDGGVEFAFEATGIPMCTEQAVKMLSYGGTATTIGFPAAARRGEPEPRRHGDRRVLEQGGACASATAATRCPRTTFRSWPSCTCTGSWTWTRW